MKQVTSLKIKYNPFAKAFQDNKERYDTLYNALLYTVDYKNVTAF